MIETVYLTTFSIFHHNNYNKHLKIIIINILYRINNKHIHEGHSLECRNIKYLDLSLQIEPYKSVYLGLIGGFIGPHVTINIIIW